MKRYLPILLLLSACNAALPSGQVNTPAKPVASSQPSANGSTLFGNAVAKRTLSLELFGGAQQQQAGRNAAESDEAASSPNQGPAAAPMPTSASGGGSAGRPGIGMGATPAMAPRAGMTADSKMVGPWFGGEFNNFVLQFAEENLFAASKAVTLLSAYRETVEPLVDDWDSKARLMESQAHIGKGKSDDGSFYLPDSNGKPAQVKVNYLFRFASSARKETLVVYLTDEDTRVHRLIWGEPDVDLAKASLDSDQAIAAARKAFTDRNASGYPVYPEQSSPEMEIIYSIPSDARWQVNLNQNAGNSRYFVSVMFEKSVPDQKEKQTVYGSVELDAASGKIQQLNRPTLYTAKYYPTVGVAENAVAVAPPPPSLPVPDPAAM